MDLKLSHTFVQVHDQDQALAFYRDVLGFEVRADMPFEEYRWLAVGPASQPGLEIVLEVPEMGRGPADGEALRALLAKGSLSTLIFLTDDCDTTFGKIRASGAEVLQEPIDQPYGVRDCAFRDPSGNAVRFSQRLDG
ncbi:glyoxalase/bleomycin resistance protein/dioxygenase [Planomonospora sphaerica]|uniref:Glyoxalase/bleomycin resistance protein/dioxygenase n=1 Tax=Planomonospora sphaerica TaxID=161355 RepID=A0A171C7I1_9ACTN|nr:glyoxalase/bleomycin resistance/extradiol dioxygenase family protein [Planomonospora sphaerica]GAT66238.1 glyoxalase/bleomycin resistance protein/dioxygenase [Planomonospora sphaerica]